MAVMLGLVFANLLGNPFDVTLWSVAIAKFVTPYAMFFLAGLVFDSEASVRRLETFTLFVLAYLSFTSIAFLAGWDFLVFPRFILDDSLGINPERARGPFLQAVANGTSINLLGLIAIDTYRRGRLRGLVAAVLLGSLPIAILATKTRAVWLSFTISLLVLVVTTSNSRVRRVCVGLIACGVVAVLALFAGSRTVSIGVQDRLMDRNTAEFRIAAYRAGWEMLQDRPLTGWGARAIRLEMEKRLDGYRGNSTVVHNTYLEILLEHGLLGFALYAWIMMGLFRLRRTPEPDRRRQASSEDFLQLPCQPLWPLLLGVYFVNATFVVMNYQFVNGLLFTWAGILARRQQTADVPNG
jgi:O-antigen ligase